MMCMKIKKISLLLSAIMIFGLCNFTTVIADNKNVYKASEAWSTQASGDSVWTWEAYKDMGKTMETLTTYSENRNRFGIDPKLPLPEEIPTAPGWSNGAAWNMPAVGEYWMIPFIKTTGTTADDRKKFGVSRTFTSPKSGNVTISTENGKIYGGSKQSGNGNTPAFIRITKNGEQIWPLNNEEFQIPGGVYPIQTVNFEPITLDILENDVIRFEAYNGDGDNGYGKYVYWAPVIRYNYLPETVSPSQMENIMENQVFTLTFPDVLDTMTEDNISVSVPEGTVTVKDFLHDQNTISFGFNGKKKYTTYNVTVSGIRVLNQSEEHTYSFTFTTGDIFEKPVYESDAAWSDTTNTHEVWRWLYRNTLTKDTLTPYVYYTLTAQNSTSEYVAPKKDEDGNYNYLLFGESTDKTKVFCDSQTNAYARNTLSRYWMRLSVATQSEPLQHKDNRIVKEFTAPKTGKIQISAKDMSGDSKIYGRRTGASNVNGAVLRIIKKTADGKEKELWTHTFQFVYSEEEPRMVLACDFDAINEEIEIGDKLWFEISGETGGSAYAKQVFWNPVVTYENVYPNITDMTPALNAQGVAPNFTQEITFDSKIAPIYPDDVEIDNGATVKSVELINGARTLAVKFNGLVPGKKYSVKLKNIALYNSPVGNDRVYEFSFTAGNAVQIGDIYLSDESLKSGLNTVCADINNSDGNKNPYSASLLAAVCRGTKENYEIVSVKSVFSKNIGENDTLSVSVEVPDKNGHFIKALLLESPSSARALTNLKYFE